MKITIEEINLTTAKQLLMVNDVFSLLYEIDELCKDRIEKNLLLDDALNQLRDIRKMIKRQDVLSFWKSDYGSGL